MSAPDFAAFLHGLDALALLAHGVDVALLVPAGSAQETWANALLRPDRVLPLRLDAALEARALGDLTTGQLLGQSDAAEQIRTRGGGRFLPSCSTSSQIHAFSREHGIPLLAASIAAQRSLGDKLRFHRLLERAGLPVPDGGVWRARPGVPPELPGRLVLQEPDSSGGEGTFFVRDGAGALELLAAGQLQAGRRYLVRRFVTGRALGITIFVHPTAIVLSALRIQGYYPRPASEPRARFAGVQWLPSAALGTRLRARIDEVARSLGELMRTQGYRGFANVDLIADEADEPWIIECNPRLSAATPQLLARPELSGGIPLARLAVDLFLRRKGQAPPAFSPVPDTAFEGATLDLLAPAQGDAAVQSCPPCGAYRLDTGGARPALAPAGVGSVAGLVSGFVSSSQHADAPFLLSVMARPGERPPADATPATILSDVPLFDTEGRLNPTAWALVSAAGLFGERTP